MFIKENQKILLVSGDSWTDPDFISAEHPTLDRHPNKKGQEKIAEYIHENI